MDDQRRPVYGSNDSRNQYYKKDANGNTAVNRPRSASPQGGYNSPRPNANRASNGRPVPVVNRNGVQKQPVRRPPAEGMTPEMIRAKRRKAAQKKMLINNFKNVSIILIIVIAISATISAIAISCVNDILALSVSEKDKQNVSVVIEDGMNTDEVINALDKAGVIKNAWFCKIAARVLGYKNEGYIARKYDFNRTMGLENMLNEIKNLNPATAKTVTLTFPEGYTADQIITMLVENDVSTREKLINTMNTVDFSKDFDFLDSISYPESRYMKLEGYLFPDTYDFYLGENAESVIRKFLNNFKVKWTEEYEARAEELGLTVDETVKLASIVAKEAGEADMPIVSSILLNRLDAGMRLECDSTSAYMFSNQSGLSAGEIEMYNTRYDTYVCEAMPIGAICNPGMDAIKAVLNHSDTGYYYFIHDANNILRVAGSLSEQEYNIATYGLAS